MHYRGGEIWCIIQRNYCYYKLRRFSIQTKSWNKRVFSSCTKILKYTPKFEDVCTFKQFPHACTHTHAQMLTPKHMESIFCTITCIEIINYIWIWTYQYRIYCHDTLLPTKMARLFFYVCVLRTVCHNGCILSEVTFLHRLLQYLSTKFTALAIGF